MKVRDQRVVCRSKKKISRGVLFIVIHGESLAIERAKEWIFLDESQGLDARRRLAGRPRHAAVQRCAGRKRQIERVRLGVGWRIDLPNEIPIRKWETDGRCRQE